MQLCLEDKVLCYSHVIPKFVIRQRSHGSGFFQIENQDPRIRKIPTGWYEKLLCRSCEEHIGKYEDYAAKFFDEHESSEPVSIKDIERYRVDAYDYKLLKLFFMSVLWKAGIATDDVFKDVALGPYEEKLRQMLLKNETGGYEDFSSVISVFHPGPKNSHKIIFTPRRKKVKNVNYYFIEFNEFSCWIKVDNRKHLDCYSEVTLTETAPLWIMERPFTQQRDDAILNLLQTQPKRLEKLRKRYKK